MITFNEINYVCEVNYPNTSAYAIHVAKMCNALANENQKVNLLVPHSSTGIKKISNDFNLKNNFNLFSIFKKKKKINFFIRIIFSIFILIKIKSKKENFFITRSVVFALIGSLFKRNVIVELHHELSGFSKIFYNLFFIFKLIHHMKYIFIHKNLIKRFSISKKLRIVLDDAVDPNNYKNYKNVKKLKKTCVYIGSFYEGKGIEIILQLSKKLPNYNFHLYGDNKFLPDIILNKNIKLFNYKTYKYIPKILSKYDIALMPYLNKVKARHKTLNISNNMSPLKMFDYLASGMLILATNLKVYKHILKNEFNSILINQNKIDDWVWYIKNIKKNKKKFNYIKRNALNTAEKYTWDKRAKKIKLFAKNFIRESI
jgi:glycosyltransferase involved in cell wall biosynthesis